MDNKWYANFIRKYHKKKINILGSTWTVEIRKEDDYLKENPNIDGYCAPNERLIIIKDARTINGYKCQNNTWIENEFKGTFRHEIIHAFFNESGLGACSLCYNNSPWPKNEEMIDWIAIQSPKIFKLFKELDIIDFKGE